MKKILIVLLSLFLFLVPFNSVFAYTGGLIAGKSMNIGYAPGDTKQTTMNLTDNDETTNIAVYNATSTSSFAKGNIAWYEFSSVATISSYKFKTGHFPVSVKFYDLNKQEIFTRAHNVTSDNSITHTPVNPIKNVKYAALVYDGTSTTATLYEFDVFGTIPPPVVHDELTNLIVSGDHQSSTLAWDIPTTNADFTGTKIYRNGVLHDTLDNITNVYNDSGLQGSTAYTYKVAATYSDGFETPGISYTFTTAAAPVNPALIPPGNVTSLTAVDITGNSVRLTWSNPNDTDLAQANIYQNGILLTSIPVSSEYVVTGLNPSTTYQFSVSYTDVDGNEGSKSVTNVTTIAAADTTPPGVPTNLYVRDGNQALYVSWSSVPDKDLAGYYVYVNGSRINTSPIQNTFYSVPNLSNGTSYSVQVSAVDTSGNESQMTAAATGTPSVSGLPIVKTKYDLVDVAKGIESWFSAYWGILAFAAAIPLSFYIAARIKLLILD